MILSMVQNVQSRLKVPVQAAVGSHSQCTPPKVRTSSSPPYPHLHHPLVSVGRVVSQLETSALGNERYTLFHFCFYFHYYKR